MGNQIRILVDCHVFDGIFQGTTTYLKGIYSEFVLDNDFHFYLASNNSKRLKEIFGNRENVSYVEYKYSGRYIRLLFEIPLIIKKYKIDFAHFQYIVPPIKCCKYIVTIHDILFIDYPKYFPFRYRIRNKYLFKWSALRSDIVLTVSEYSKNQIVKNFNIEQVHITPNAVDPIYFEPYDKKKIKAKILKLYSIDNYWIYVSRWEPRKNHHSLLKVFVENKYYEKYFLVFVGNDAINNRAYDLYFETLSDNIKSRIIRFQKVEMKELVDLIRGANISVYPSFAEGFGIPPLEALAANVSSICSNTTAMSDFDFMANMKFDPFNLEHMRDCIEANINIEPNEQIKQELATKYNWKNSVKRLKHAIEFFNKGI